MREIVSGGSTLGAILVGPPGVLRRLLRIKAPQAGTSAALEGRQSLGALSALRPAARLGTPATFLCDEMPIGLEEGIVMTMLRNAGSLKNDKKFNMREIVIDTETTGLDLLRLKQSTRQEHQTNEFLPASHGDQSDGSSSDRREQYEQMGVLGDQRRKSVEDGASASHGVRAEHLERKVVEGARDPIFDSHAPSGPCIKLAAKSETTKGGSFKTPPKDRLRVGPSLPVSKMS